MEAGQDVEGKALVAGFGRDVFSDGKEVRKACREGGCSRVAIGVVGVVEERPCSSCVMVVMRISLMEGSEVRVCKVVSLDDFVLSGFWHCGVVGMVRS